jgi:hypothetical protein
MIILLLYMFYLIKFCYNFYMLSSHRTYSHNELKKLLKDYKLNNNVTKASAKSSMIINY